MALAETFGPRDQTPSFEHFDSSTRQRVLCQSMIVVAPSDDDVDDFATNEDTVGEIKSGNGRNGGELCIAISSNKMNKRVDENGNGQLNNENKQIDLIARNMVEAGKTVKVEEVLSGQDENDAEDELPKSARMEWLRGLEESAELETMSILYAKSILGNQHQLPMRVPIDIPSLAQRKSCFVNKIAVNSQKPPAKPQRCVTRVISCSVESKDIAVEPRHDTAAVVQWRKGAYNSRMNGLNGNAIGEDGSCARRLALFRDQSPATAESIVVYRSTVCLPSTSLASSLILNPSTTVSVFSKHQTEHHSSGEHSTKIHTPKILQNSRQSHCGRFEHSLPNNGLGLTENIGKDSPSVTDSFYEQRRRSDQNVSNDIPPNCITLLSPRHSSKIVDYTELPFCDPVYHPKVQYRAHKRHLRLPAFRHSIRVNENDVTFLGEREHEQKRSEFVPNASSSPKSDSTANSSLDSGQCSGGHETSPSSFVVPMSYLRERERSEKPRYNTTTFEHCDLSPAYIEALPSYARMANTIDNVLRTSNAIYSLLNLKLENSWLCRDLLSKTQSYIQLIQRSDCVQHFSNSDIDLVICAMKDVENQGDSGRKNETIPVLNNYFTIVVRKMLDQTLVVFVRLICKYLAECVNKDQLLVIALEHLIHLLLFGDELCLEAIKHKAIDNLVRFCRMSSTPSDTTKLLLRALAVLCGTVKGCLQLLSIGGLDVVVRILLDSAANFDCSVEASGVMTQLTNPGRNSFVKLSQSLQPILLRLLSLIDQCSSSESLLLCVAAIANLSLQNPCTVELLYAHNAIRHLVNAFHRPNCANIFAQEQIVTILSRMASRAYEQALIAQGAIPVLLQMLTLTNAKHKDYCRRIKYKAAVCLGTIASTGAGLKALYENKGYTELCDVLEAEGQNASPLLLICSSIKQRLENTYKLETAV